MRLAIRSLLRSPIYSIFSIVTLAIGLGVLVTADAVLRVIIGPPPGVSAPGRVFELFSFPGEDAPMISFSWPDYEDLREYQTAFEAVTAWTVFRPPLVAGGRAQVGFVEAVDGDFFRVVGTTAAIGRLLRPSDDVPDAQPVIVLSFSTWTSTFGRDAQIVGKTVRLGPASFEIVGVAHPEFSGMFNGGVTPAKGWISLRRAAEQPEFGLASLRRRDVRERESILVIARLRADRSPASGQAELTRIGQRLDERYPPDPRHVYKGQFIPWHTRQHWGLRPIEGRINGISNSAQRIGATVVFSALSTVVLVVCANLSNLVLARVTRRRKDWAVRSALGASPLRLVRSVVVESGVLVLAGSAGAALLAWWLTAWTAAHPMVLPVAALEVRPKLDAGAFLVLVPAAFVVLVVSAVWPALRACRPRIIEILASEGPGASPRWRGRGAIIAVQVAASVVLIAWALMAGQQIRRHNEKQPGMDLDRLALAEVDFSTMPEARAREISEAITTRLRTMREVENVSISSGVPLGSPAGRSPHVQLKTGASPAWSVVLISSTPEVFQTLGIPILRGRGISALDRQDSASIVVLSESAAQALFGTVDVVGRSVSLQRSMPGTTEAAPPRPLVIAGVARDTESIHSDHPIAAAYVPLSQHYEASLVVAARTDGRVAISGNDLAKVLLETEPELAVGAAGSARQVFARLDPMPSVISSVFGAVGSFAAVLALAGLVGVLLERGAGRRLETGTRLALGASPSRVRWLIVRQGLVPVGFGLVAGLVIVLLCRRWLNPFTRISFPDVDHEAFVLVSVAFLIGGFLACYFPARRASRVDPNVVLRNL